MTAYVDGELNLGLGRFVNGGVHPQVGGNTLESFFEFRRHVNVQVGVLDFTDGSRNEPGSVGIDGSVEDKVVVDKSFGPEGTAVVTAVRKTDVALVVKDVVNDDLRVASPAASADVQIRVKLDFVVFGKDV